MWWPQLVKLRVKAPICLPPAEECLKFPKGSNKIPRYMAWEEDPRATAINTLNYYWHPGRVIRFPGT